MVRLLPLRRHRERYKEYMQQFSHTDGCSLHRECSYHFHETFALAAVIDIPFQIHHAIGYGVSANHGTLFSGEAHAQRNISDVSSTMLPADRLCYRSSPKDHDRDLSDWPTAMQPSSGCCGEGRTTHIRGTPPASCSLSNQTCSHLRQSPTTLRPNSPVQRFEPAVYIAVLNDIVGMELDNVE